jgi:hypothetical protein
MSRWKRDNDDFAADLECAHAEFMADRLHLLMAARTASGQADWRVQKWLLEKTFPEEYGRANARSSSSSSSSSSSNNGESTGTRNLKPGTRNGEAPEHPPGSNAEIETDAEAWAQFQTDNVISPAAIGMLQHRKRDDHYQIVARDTCPLPEDDLPKDEENDRAFAHAGLPPIPEPADFPADATPEEQAHWRAEVIHYYCVSTTVLRDYRAHLQTKRDHLLAQKSGPQPPPSPEIAPPTPPSTPPTWWLDPPDLEEALGA